MAHQFVEFAEDSVELMKLVKGFDRRGLCKLIFSQFDLTFAGLEEIGEGTVKIHLLESCCSNHDGCERIIKLLETLWECDVQCVDSRDLVRPTFEYTCDRLVASGDVGING